MANTLTSLINPMFAALEVVSRELVGFIPAVARDSRADRVAVGQTLKIPVAGDSDLEAITPGATPADSGDTTSSTVDVSMSSAYVYPIRMTGEETLALSNTGTYEDWMRQRFERGFRKLTNAIEADLATTYASASRAYGTAGTTPFGTAGDLSDVARVKEILEDNGAPTGDLQLVLSNAAKANMASKQSVLFKVNEAGRSDMLREGMTDRLQGFALRQSGQAASHTKGAGASYVINNGDVAVGSTTISIDGGTVNTTGFKAGDVITIADEPTGGKYVVKTGLTSTAGNIVINEPGLTGAIVDGKAVTIGNSYSAAGLAFDRSAIVLATRAPAEPEGGDDADDVMMLTDPVSGLTFEVRYYRQYRRAKIEIGLVWGFKAIKPAHIALLLG